MGAFAGLVTLRDINVKFTSPSARALRWAAILGDLNIIRYY
jgi:hypothetical protein